MLTFIPGFNDAIDEPAGDDNAVSDGNYKIFNEIKEVLPFKVF